MRIGSVGASLLIHGFLLGILVIPGGRMVASLPMPLPTPNVTMLLVELSKQAPKPVVRPGTIQYPHKRKKRPVAIAPKPRPAPVKVAIKPTPAPTPKPREDRDHKVFEALRRSKEFAGMTDEQIRKMPLPPGMKSWQDVLAMTGNLDKLDWTTMPPDTVDKTAASGSAGLFGWAPVIWGLDKQAIGGTGRQLTNGRWQFVYQFQDMMYVAEWPDGAVAATVAYYPAGSRPDPGKTFQVAVKPADKDPGDRDLIGDITTQYLLIKNGLPPNPLPSAVSSSAH